MIVYDSLPEQEHNLLQVDDKPRMEPIFHLFPSFQLQCVFPVYEYQYNSFMCYLLLPQMHYYSLTFFESECISISLDGNVSASLSLRWNDHAKLYKIDPPTSAVVESNALVKIPVDPNHILSIFYCVPDHNTIIIRISSHILMFSLLYPLNDITQHISSIRLMNHMEVQNALETVGVMGIYLYNSESDHYWFRVPTTAAVFPTIGCHTTYEDGITKENNQPSKKLNHKLRLLYEKDASHPYSWQDFLFADDRADNSHNMVVRNQFCYYNNHCCFNKNVSFEYESTKMILGYELRPGSMYWKTLLALHDFELRMAMDLPSEPSDYIILWLSCMTLPSCVYLSHIQKACIEKIIFGSDEDAYWVPSFRIDWPIICLILYRSTNDLQFYYAYTTVEEGQPCIHLSGKQSLSDGSPPLGEGRGSLSFKIKDTLISLQLNSIELPMCLPQVTWNMFPSDGLVLPGLIGYNVAVYTFIVSSDTNAVNSYTADPAILTLQSLGQITAQQELVGLPCHITYQNQICYASKDSKLNNPPKYSLEGFMFCQDESKTNYSIIGKDDQRNTVLYFDFFENNPLRSILCINQNNCYEIKHISSRKDSLSSCFKGNRLACFGCVYGGLTNSFNTCFQNSTLQLLFHSGKLKQSIFSLYKEYCASDCSKESASFKCIQALVLTLTRLQVSIRASEFNDVMLALKDRFEIGIQHVHAKDISYI